MMRFAPYLLFLSSIILPVFADENAKDGDLEKKINWLIDRIEKSNLTFIRNDVEYNSKDAVAHLRKKYAHVKDKVHSIEDFVNYVASQSYTTGKPYLLKNEKGEVVKAKDWLLSVFKKEYAGAEVK